MQNPMKFACRGSSASQNTACLRAVLSAARYVHNTPGCGAIVLQIEFAGSTSAYWVVDDTDVVALPGGAKSSVLVWIAPLECWPTPDGCLQDTAPAGGG